MMGDTTKYKFWRAVEECLVQFHQQGRKEAFSLVLKFQKDLHEGPEGLMYDMVFHFEPFALACTIAQKEVKIEDADYQEKYIQQILMAS